jgi:hypothetical protein
VPNRVRFDGIAERFYIFSDAATGRRLRYTLLNPLDSHPSASGAL